jgi:methylmalonyl-CoA/ethylmalonyl-CoA epimerase
MTADTAFSGLPIHHIGIAVHSISTEKPTFELLTGATGSRVEDVASQQVRVTFVGALELLEPMGPESTIARFLERRGQGLHHVAYACDDIESELARLSESGFDLIDSVPRPGAHGHRVAFLHPATTGGVLIELVEDQGAVEAD